MFGWVCSPLPTTSIIDSMVVTSAVELVEMTAMVGHDAGLTHPNVVHMV